MRFDKGLYPHILVPIAGWIAFLGFVFAGCAVTGSFLRPLLPGGMAQTATTFLNSQTPSPSLPATVITHTLGPLITLTVSATNTQVVRVPPTDTPEPPTPEPTATRYYVISAQPTRVPTPVFAPAAPFPETCDGPGRMNILVVGIDGFVDNYYRAARADVIMMLGVNFAARSANLLSFPRDLWVALPNLPQVGQGRINTAYTYGEHYAVPGGGPAELAAVMADTFALRVDRHIVVNFLAFERGIDAIGGIDIVIPNPIHDARYPLRDGSGTIAIDFPAGPVHMDGATALIYSRIRHDSSDFQRMRRQHQVLFAIRDRLLSPETIPHLPALTQSLVGTVRTNLSVDDFALLGCLGPKISREAIVSRVIDHNLVENVRLESGAQVLMPRMDQIVPLLEQFNIGE
jgi:polyisoprenyl-teichoic acid--peptidoglycan teichoic acid transferase